MSEANQRLREARIKAGYETATDAAKAFGWKPPTYMGHENGDRPISKRAAIKYAAALKVDIMSLLYDKEPRTPRNLEAPIDLERLALMFGYLLHWRGLPADEAEVLSRAVVEYASRPPAPGAPAPDRETARVEAQAVMRMLGAPQRR